MKSIYQVADELRELLEYDRRTLGRRPNSNAELLFVRGKTLRIVGDSDKGPRFRLYVWGRDQALVSAEGAYKYVDSWVPGISAFVGHISIYMIDWLTKSDFESIQVARPGGLRTLLGLDESTRPKVENRRVADVLADANRILQIVESDEFSSYRLSGVSLAEAVISAIRESKELFFRLRAAGDLQRINLAADIYLDLLAKLKKILESALLRDLALNPQYVFDAEGKSKKIVEAVNAFETQSVRNIRQLNDDADLDFQVLLNAFGELGKDDLDELYRRAA
jgi:hypothetical protein